MKNSNELHTIMTPLHWNSPLGEDLRHLSPSGQTLGQHEHVDPDPAAAYVLHM